SFAHGRPLRIFPTLCRPAHRSSCTPPFPRSCCSFERPASHLRRSASAAMRYIEPHAHMVSRVIDDYVAMTTAGCAAVCEPAFWAGFDRSSAQGFYDYFCQLTDFEPKRAAKYGLPHFSWLCINPKESEDMELAKEVLAIIPEFMDRETVLGIGE